MTIRSTFLKACDVADAFISSEPVRAAWNEPSALSKMTVGHLTGHLVRAVTSVLGYLDAPSPGGPAQLDAPGYFLAFDLDADIDSTLHRAVRARAARESEGGHAAVVDLWRAALESLRIELARAADDRLVATLGGNTLQLDQYLITRLVEVVAHTDDLASSIGIDAPEFDSAATGFVVDCLTTVARRKHGDLAVIRAMIRRERDQIEALRVF